MKNTASEKKFLFISGSGDTFVWFRLDLMIAIQSMGYKIFAAAPYISDENLTILQKHDIEFINISLERKSLNPFNFFHAVFQLNKIINKLKPLVIFSYMHKSILATGLATILQKDIEVYYMITGLGHLFERNTLLMRIFQKLSLIFFSLSFQNAKGVFFQNEDDFEEFLKLKLVSPKKSYLVNGSGVNLNKFAICGLPSSPIFMTMGRLLESKGMRDYAEAASIVKKKFPEAKFFLYGYPDLHEDSIDEKEIVETWNERFGVEYMGFCNNPARAIADSSIFVLLSYREGTPRSTLEAMAMGRPIITNDVPGCRETVVPGRNGFLVNAKDIESAADAMIALCDPKLRNRMGQESFELAKEKYDVYKVNKSIIERLELD